MRRFFFIVCFSPLARYISLSSRLWPRHSGGSSHLPSLLRAAVAAGAVTHPLHFRMQRLAGAGAQPHEVHLSSKYRRTRPPLPMDSRSALPAEALHRHRRHRFCLLSSSSSSSSSSSLTIIAWFGQLDPCLRLPLSGIRQLRRCLLVLQGPHPPSPCPCC